MVVEEKTLILWDTAATGVALLAVAGWGGADRVAPTGISFFVLSRNVATTLCRGLAGLGELWPPSRQGLGELWRRADGWGGAPARTALPAGAAPAVLGSHEQMVDRQVSEEGAGDGLEMYATW
jgi:hypothetical protein